MTIGEIVIFVLIALLTLASLGIAMLGTHPFRWWTALIIGVIIACWVPDGVNYAKFGLTICTLGPMAFAFFLGAFCRCGRHNP